MAAKSRLEDYRRQITILINSGASIRSSWKIINAMLPAQARMSYNAFYHFVKLHIK